MSNTVSITTSLAEEWTNENFESLLVGNVKVIKTKEKLMRSGINRIRTISGSPRDVFDSIVSLRNGVNEDLGISGYKEQVFSSCWTNDTPFRFKKEFDRLRISCDSEETARVIAGAVSGSESFLWNAETSSASIKISSSTVNVSRIKAALAKNGIHDPFSIRRTEVASINCGGEQMHIGDKRQFMEQSFPTLEDKIVANALGKKLYEASTHKELTGGINKKMEKLAEHISSVTEYQVNFRIVKHSGCKCGHSSSKEFTVLRNDQKIGSININGHGPQWLDTNGEMEALLKRDEVIEGYEVIAAYMLAQKK